MKLDSERIYNTLGRTNIHIDYHTPPWQKLLGVNFDGDALGKALKEANVDSVTIFAKDFFGMAFYYTNVGYRHPNLQKDILKEAIRGCHKYGVKVLAYFTVCLDTAAANEHQEWMQVGTDGKPVGNYKDGAVSFVCLNSSYMEENLLPMVIEVSRDYDVDGIFFDELYIAPEACVCPACVRNMKLRGMDPNKEEDRAKFGAITCDMAAERLTRTIHYYKPEIPVVYNPTLRIHGLMDTLIQNEDFIVVGGHESGLGYVNMLMESRHVRNYDMPILGMSAIFHKRWGDFGSVKNPYQLRYEIAEMLSHHFMVSVGDHQMPHGEMEYAKYKVIGDAFKIVKDLNLPLRAKPVYDIAIIHPGMYDARQIRQNETTIDGIRTVWPFDNGIAGAAKYLTETHQQYEVLSVPQAMDLIDKMNTIVLPESADLSEEVCEKIRTFVKEGGTLIATGVASLSHGHFLLADVMGVEFLNEPAHVLFANSPYARLLDYTEGVPEGIDMKLYSCPINVRTAEDAEIKGYLVSGVASDLRYTRLYHGGPAEHLLTDPCVVKHPYGKGVCIYIANDMFRSYIKSGYYVHRNFLNNIFRSVQKNRVIESECSANVHFNLMRCEDGIYLHTVQYYCEDSGEYYARINTEPPRIDLDVKVNIEGLDNVEAVNDTDFTFEKTEKGLNIHMKNVGQYHVLRLTGEKK